MGKEPRAKGDSSHTNPYIKVVLATKIHCLKI